MSMTVLVEGSKEDIVLCPRPYARHAGHLLIVPLLPRKAPLRPLPFEIWSKILMMAFAAEDKDEDRRAICLKTKKEFSDPRWKLVFVSKMFKVSSFLSLSNCV